MRVLIDADASPINHIAIDICKRNNIDIILFFDDSHIFNDDYAKVIITSQGADSVDYLLLQNIIMGDIVITQDYGLASLALLKTSSVISPNGLIYTNQNIDELLYKRYLGKMARLSNTRTKGPKKRTLENDMDFIKTLNSIIKNN